LTDYLLIQALNGLVIGIIYAVIAAGLTVIFSILKIVNFAHGEVYMMGGYFAYFAIAFAGIPPLPAVLVAMALSFVLSIMVERTLLTPLYSPTTERKGDYGILVTFGISIFLRALALIVYGPYPLRPPSFWPGVAVAGGLVMAWDRVFAGGAGIASRANPPPSSASTPSASTCLPSASAARWPAAPAPSSGRSIRCRRRWACCPIRRPSPSSFWAAWARSPAPSSPG
jgi:hypothetical protein